jgi:DegV family protein with EDD domain
MARPVAIVTDTTHYLPRELADANGLHQVSLYVSRDERAQPEAEIVDYARFYDELRDMQQLPTTSQPSIGDFTAVYEPLLAAGHDILSVHLSGGISGTVGAAAQAREIALDDRTEGRIEVLDSETACGGLGFVLLAAAAAARLGGDVDAVLERARAARAGLKIWFCIDTLEYLRRGGRVGNAQAWLGGALKIKPILSIEREITPVERVRTAGRAFERMVEYARELNDNGANGWMVQHIRAEQQAQKLVERAREIFGCDPICISEVGPVIGTYTGPGLIGVGGVARELLA